MVFLPFNQKQVNRQARVFSPAFIFFTLSLFILIPHQKVSGENEDRLILGIRFRPDVTQELRDRQQSMTRRYSPLREPSLEAMGVRNLDTAITEKEVREARQTLEVKHKIPVQNSVSLLLGVALSKILPMQIQAADWHPRFRPERIEFVSRELFEQSSRALQKDSKRLRRTYVLRKINADLQMPFALESLFDAQGMLRIRNLEQQFSRTKQILESQGLNVDQEFRDYIEVLVNKWRSFLDKHPDSVSVDWTDYKSLSHLPVLNIAVPSTVDVHDAKSLTYALFQMLRNTDLALEDIQAKHRETLPEMIFGFLAAERRVNIDLNKPIPDNQSIYSELGPTQVPPQELRYRSDLAWDELAIRQLIFEAFNPSYLEEIYGQELRDWGLRNSSDYRRATMQPDPHRRDIEARYAERTHPKSDDLRYMNRAQIRWMRSRISLPDGFELDKASSYFRDQSQLSAMSIMQSLGKSFEDEAAAAGFKDIEEAAGRGFSFPSSLNQLPNHRREAFQSLIRQLGPFLMAHKLETEELVIEGKPEELQTLFEERMPGEESAESIRSFKEFVEVDLFRKGERSFFPIYNELVQTESGDYLDIWMFVEAKAMAHHGLYQQDRYIYGEIESELQSESWERAVQLLIHDFLSRSVYYQPLGGHPYGERYKDLGELLSGVKSSDLPQMLKVAALLEHERSLREDQWWAPTVMPRYQR